MQLEDWSFSTNHARSVRISTSNGQDALRVGSENVLDKLACTLKLLLNACCVTLQAAQGGRHQDQTVLDH